MQDGSDREKIRPVRELPTKFSKGKISIVYINVMAPEVAITSVVRDIVSEEFPSSDDWLNLDSERQRIKMSPREVMHSIILTLTSDEVDGKVTKNKERSKVKTD